MSQSVKRLLIIAMHRPQRSPGQRYRFEQYIKDLENEGVHCTLRFLLNEKDDHLFYSKGNYIQKARILIRSYYQRMRHLREAKNYDLVFIYREALVTGSLFFERALFRKSIPFVLDFDDAIWNNNTSIDNQKFSFLKNPKKLEQQCKWASMVFVGNEYLATYAKKYNHQVYVMPTTIDLEQYAEVKTHYQTEVVTIGWTGSHTTLAYYEELKPVFLELKKKYGAKIRFALIGDARYSDPALELQGIAWNESTEAHDLLAFDIGVMPLPDNEWTRGKCGCKGLQYMGVGIPAVMAAVGTNTEIIDHGKNGLLAYTNDDWFNHLSALIDSEELRKELGMNGRKSLEERYSRQVWASKWVDLLSKKNG